MFIHLQCFFHIFWHIAFLFVYSIFVAIITWKTIVQKPWFSSYYNKIRIFFLIWRWICWMHSFLNLQIFKVILLHPISQLENLRYLLVCPQGTDLAQHCVTGCYVHNNLLTHAFYNWHPEAASCLCTNFYSTMSASWYCKIIFDYQTFPC